MEQVECGAAALGMVLAHFGRWVQLRELREACGISRDGASALDIVKAGRQYGVEGTGHVGEISKMEGMAVPAIVWLRRSHFVILEGARDGTFHLNDPDGGRYSLNAHEFVEAYQAPPSPSRRPRASSAAAGRSASPAASARACATAAGAPPSRSPPACWR